MLTLVVEMLSPLVVVVIMVCYHRLVTEKRNKEVNDIMTNVLRRLESVEEVICALKEQSGD